MAVKYYEFVLKINEKRTKELLLNESAKLRALRALMPYVPRASRAPFFTCFRASRASCPTCLVSSVLSCTTCSRALRVSCPTCSRVSRASCFTCLVSYVPRANRALVSHVSCDVSFVKIFILLSTRGCYYSDSSFY